MVQIHSRDNGNFGIGHMSGSTMIPQGGLRFAITPRTKVAGVLNEAESKQTLADAAAEIQRLLQQLEKSNPAATETEKQAFVTAAIAPEHRSRIVSAMQAGGEKALEEFLKNPYVNVVMAIVKGWQEQK